MPIYMDRHNVSDFVTAENVALLHQADLKVQHEFGCRGLTYWFDDQRKIAFCLIEAPDKESIVQMHTKAHGEIANEIIEVDPLIVESFLGRIKDPESTDHHPPLIDESVLRYIMVIYPSTDKKQEVSISDFGNIIADHIAVHKGKIVKRNNHQTIVSFSAGKEAVSSAVAIMKEAYKKGIHDAFKIGISAGVPVTDRKILFEEAVKTAEFLGRAGKGVISVSHEAGAFYQKEDSNLPGLYVISKKQEKFMMDFIRFLDEHWNKEDLDLTFTLKKLGQSKSGLYRKLTELTGMSLNDILLHHRLDIAREMILEKDMNIAEIAYRVGFSSPSYFTKCFYKKFHFLPSEYPSGENS